MKTIERVRLSEIKPNEDNPRRDFGDISALADSIRSTGGEPVNPIVCARDANMLFIVDGERRYRAMREIYGDGDPEVAVTVLDGWREGADVLAALATDNKKRLGEDEMSRGYQLAFDLGTDYVDDDRLAMATGRRADDVASARAVWGRLGRAERERYAQCSLEQFAAAREFEGRDREAVLKAKPDSWRLRAQSLRESARKRELVGKAMDAAAEAGIEWVEASEEDLAGYRALRTLHVLTDENVGALAATIAETGAAFALHLKRSWCGELVLAGPADGGAGEPDRAKEEAARAHEIVAELKRRLRAFLAVAPSTGALRAWAVTRRIGWRLADAKEALSGNGMDPGEAERLLSEPASFYELWSELDSMSTFGAPTGWAEVLAAAKRDGYEASEDDEWLAGYLDRMGGDGR